MTRFPKARIKQHPHERIRAANKRKRVRFRFKAKLAGATFECRMDGRRWRACDSPRSHRVGRGGHRFRVRALNGTLKGETDSFRFRVVDAS